LQIPMEIYDCRSQWRFMIADPNGDLDNTCRVNIESDKQKNTNELDSRSVLLKHSPMTSVA